MARKIKDIVHAGSGLSVPLRFDKKDNLFIAEYLGRRFAGPTVAAVEAPLLEAIEASLHYEWLDVLDISVPNEIPWSRVDPRPQRVEYVPLLIARYHVTHQPDGRLFYCAWETAPEARLQALWPFHGWNRSEPFEVPKVRAPYQTPWQIQQHGLLPPDRFFLPYAEEHWERLGGLLVRLAILRAAILGALPCEDGARLDDLIDRLSRINVRPDEQGALASDGPGVPGPDEQGAPCSDADVAP